MPAPAVQPNWAELVLVNAAPLAWMLPPTYVFEGMRALLIEHTFRADLMLQSLTLNAILFAAAVFAFLQLLKGARRQGTLLQTGE